MLEWKGYALAASGVAILVVGVVLLVLGLARRGRVPAG